MRDNNQHLNLKAKGGMARAKVLTSEQRKAIARKAAFTRWNADIPTASNEGEFKIGDTVIAAAVLPNGKRIITQATFLRALGRSRSPKAGTGVFSTVDGVPFFLQAEALKPFISQELIMSTTPIFYLTLAGGRGVGYDAELLPKVCEVYLAFRDWCMKEYRGIPDRYKRYEHIIAACDIAMRGMARIGIIALVDEATGYQYERARRALEEILQKFISNELRKWVKTFPDEFYFQVCRLKGWRISEIPSHRTLAFGRMTVDLVYERLAPNLYERLKKIVVRDEKGKPKHKPKHKLWQRLSEDVGEPKLREHLASEITLMRIFDDRCWDDFYKAVNKALPKQVYLPLFDQAEGATNPD